MSIPKQVLVIGAGPTGLVCLRNLVLRGKFEHVELWERRDDVGGVWYFDEPTSQDEKPRWPSPAYEGLIGDVLPSFLCFCEFPFSDTPTTPQQPFPSLRETHEYLHTFAEPFLKDDKIKLNREVVRVFERERGKMGWSVTYRDWNRDGREVEEVWDAVAVAVGFYDTPVWPDTEGLEELKQLGLAKHAKWFRGTQDPGYEGKKILVIGNANSSNDIAAHLSSVSGGPVYQSIRRPKFPSFPALPNESIKMVAPVSRYNAIGNKFNALLTDGTLLTDVDYVHCGTGYRPFPHFIHVLNEDRRHIPFTSDEVIPWRVPMLHRFTMYAHNPSLAFVGAPNVFTPFAVADLVSTWLALAWLSETPYPDTAEGRLVYEQERLSNIAKRRAEVENPTSFLSFRSMTWPEELEYASGFRADIVKARPELGKVLPLWDEERTKAREAMFNTKRRALEYARDHSCALSHAAV